MIRITFVLALLTVLLSGAVAVPTCDGFYTYYNRNWGGQKEEGKLRFMNFPSQVNGWQGQIDFSGNVQQIDAYEGKSERCNGNSCSFDSEYWNSQVNEGGTVEMDFNFSFEGEKPEITGLKVGDTYICKNDGNVSDGIEEEDNNDIDNNGDDNYGDESNDEGATSVPTCDGFYTFYNRNWGGQKEEGKLRFMNFPNQVNGWTAHIDFSGNVHHIDAYEGKYEWCNGQSCGFESEHWNSQVNEGGTVEMDFNFSFEGEKPEITGLKVGDTYICKNDGIIPDGEEEGEEDNNVDNNDDGNNEEEGTPDIPTCEGYYTYYDRNWGQVEEGKLSFKNFPNQVYEWTGQIDFSGDVEYIDAYEGKWEWCNGKYCGFTSEHWNSVVNKGATVEMDFNFRFVGEKPEITGMRIGDTYICKNDGNIPDDNDNDDNTNDNNGGDNNTDDNGDNNDGGNDNTNDNGDSNDGGNNNNDGNNDNTNTDNGDENPDFDGNVLGEGSCVNEKYNYGESMMKSLLFYEAQRSGKLPASNRISWRSDSAMGDVGHNGEDLTGGYYDAGDGIKFGFPAAAAMTILAWGGVDYKQGWEDAAEYQNLQDAVKWGTDFMIKAHPSPDEFYAQVGNGVEDHKFWGRVEDMTMNRPAYKVDCNNPGSDVAGESAAAMAAASMMFNDTNGDYSEELLIHAKQLCDFAERCPGKYSDVISDAAIFYKSWNGYWDELAWCNVWLHRATSEQQYLDKAEQIYNDHVITAGQWFSWDGKNNGVSVLLAKLTDKQQYKDDVQGYCDDLVYNKPKSPKGEVFISEWGSLRYAANAALICLQASEIGIKKEEYRAFAAQQANYCLGDQGRSFQIGFGRNYPVRPHHGTSNCDLAPAPCGWDDYNDPGPNKQLLEGALVGGPKAADDYYADDRKDYVMNEVALDYNAGFTSLVAGLKTNSC